ncbi:hypothetical protein KUM39_19750 [Streptomyces sp. J2-1]|uniref:hypothetical protein n=1 Tax=Streptomyces corallincola TaxID=2851888 RepID=UPI001C383572|nr:hypothetical protein [Streptomyces corallincola]MBV2356584.1 hypothetical protein [Streptomyces corallincola]
MHPYDTPRRSAYPSVPSARAGQEGPGATSATPIFDTLYAEWGKTFRTLPGDRSGEEELEFSAFGSAPHSTGSYRANSYSAYSAGAYSARNGGQQQPQWQRVGTLGRPSESGSHYVPAALPPAPRRGA